jgi:tetratricopeptide (TPR) repeat protein
MRKATGILCFLSLTLAFPACGPSPKVVSVEVTDRGLKVDEAKALVEKGHYLAFKRAVRIYGGLYQSRAIRPKIAAPYLEALLLLALREKDIGITNPATAAQAGQVLRENPALAGYEPCVTLLSAVQTRALGVMRYMETASGPMAASDALNKAEKDLRRRAATDDFAAYVLAAHTCSFSQYSGNWQKPEEFLKSHPGSLLLKYETAICGEGMPELLEEIQAHYFLSQAELRQGKLLSAEGHLIKAFEAIPESPLARLLLAGIYFATEEFDRSLQFYDLALESSPENREALLGKAICLSYLGKRDEAIAVLNRMLELGSWLLGEAHYWLAWNLHELKRDPEALGHTDEAKGRLPTNSEVFSLSGTISLDLGDLVRAEKDFVESLQYNAANTESLFGLGIVEGRKNRWEESGAYYEKAGRSSESTQAGLKAKVEGIRAAALSEERKARLIRKREAQIERARLMAATAYYDSAAAYLNAGLKDKALATAARSAAHPALKEKTDELLRTIKK